MTQIIAIAGKAGSGKDTVAEYIRDTYANCYIEAFAEPLKIACAAAFGIPLENFHDKELKEQPVELWGVSPRKIAQFVGTELFRTHMNDLVPWIGDRFWSERMWALIRGDIATDIGAIYTEEDTVLIPDLRFQNEYEMIQSQGGIVIHLTREGADGIVGIHNHSSEAGLLFNDSHTYLIENNGSKEDLYEEVEEILSQSTHINLYKSTLTLRK